MANSRNFGWPLAFTAVAIATLLIGAFAVFYTLRSARSAGSAAIESGREVLADLESIARAFRSGSIEISFLSHATRIAGSSRLQFATLDQVEVFERTDRAALLWGRLQLPEVVVRATAPVQYTYYLDLDDAWRFELQDDDRILVTAPPIRFNQPAIDVSRLDYEVRSGSALRNEEASLEQLRLGLAEMARARAGENVELVREMGRRKTEEFVEGWLFRDFGETARRYHVDVVFEGETEDRRPGLDLEMPGERAPG